MPLQCFLSHQEDSQNTENTPRMLCSHGPQFALSPSWMCICLHTVCGQRSNLYFTSGICCRETCRSFAAKADGLTSTSSRKEAFSLQLCISCTRWRKKESSLDTPQESVCSHQEGSRHTAAHRTHLQIKLVYEYTLLLWINE